MGDGCSEFFLASFTIRLMVQVPQDGHGHFEFGGSSDLAGHDSPSFSFMKEGKLDGSREGGIIPVSASRPAPSYGYAGPPHQQEVGVAPGLLCLVADIGENLTATREI